MLSDVRRTRETAMMELYTKFLIAFQPTLFKDKAGVTAIEYGLIAALVAVVCITAWKLLGTNLSTAFNNVANSV
jgi:pilus assembly protein Flp/PilA